MSIPDGDLSSLIGGMDLGAIVNHSNQIFMSGYKIGYEAGYRDGMKRVMDMVEAAVKGPKLPENPDAPV